MKPLTIILADDHVLVREGLCELLKREPGMQIIGEAGNGYDAVKKVKSLNPDILVLDIMMPRLNGIDVANLIRQATVNTKIIVLSMYQKRLYVREVLRSGAMGYVLKTSPGAELVNAIKTVGSGNYYLSHGIKTDIIEDFIRKDGKESRHEAYDLLTEREQQVFRMIAEGGTIRQIADILCISPKTVEKHRANVSKKLNVTDPVSMVKYAVKIGIIDTEDWFD